MPLTFCLLLSTILLSAQGQPAPPSLSFCTNGEARPQNVRPRVNRLFEANEAVCRLIQRESGAYSTN